MQPEDTDEHDRESSTGVIPEVDAPTTSVETNGTPRDVEQGRARYASHTTAAARATKAYHVSSDSLLGRLQFWCSSPEPRHQNWKLGRRLLALLFVAQFSLLGVWLERGSFFSVPRTVVGAMASSALALLCLSFARRRPQRAILALVLGVILFSQLCAVALYHAPIDLQIARAARGAWPDVRRTAWSSAPFLAAFAVVTSIAEWFLLSNALTIQFQYDRLSFATLLVIALSVGPPIERSSAELRFLSATRAIFDAPPTKSRGAPRLPILPSSRREVPDVLLVITESVRASDYASSPDHDPFDNPEVAALEPQRIGLDEIRSASSYTTISVATITTGRAQLGSREDIAGAPNLFDVVKSIRIEGQPMRVAYYADQSVTGVFERADIRASCDRFVALEDLDESCAAKGLGPSCPKDSLDERIVSLFEDEMATMPSPALVVLHLYNTHVPYAFPDATAKYRPYTRSVSWEGMDELHNAYKNSIVEQDRKIARAIRAFVETRRQSPTVVMLTSDHGEAFGEHHGIHHGQSLFDEQTHVPGFIAASREALDPDARKRLAERAKGPTSHYDVMPTILDWLGVWDSPAFASYRSAMLGESLLSPKGAPRALPMTSCNASFACPLDTWGMLGEQHALVSQSWDGRWKCVLLDDVATSDEEAPECERLRVASKGYFPTLPGGKPNQ